MSISVYMHRSIHMYFDIYRYFVFVLEFIHKGNVQVLRLPGLMHIYIHTQQTTQHTHTRTGGQHNHGF